MEKWVRKEKTAQKLPSFLEAIKSDLLDYKLRYKYIEELVRNFPGNLGLFLRYHLLKRFFKSVGSDVIFWPGLRIKHPWNMVVGDSVQMGFDNHYQASMGITIKKNTIIGPNVNIWTINHVYSDIKKPIKDQGYEKKSVEIGENCWITTGCFILPGARIPNGCVVLPKSVVGVMKIPEDSIIGGNPARVIGKRALIGAFKKY